MLYVKMMSAQDMPDDSPYKNYEIITVGNGDELSFDFIEKDEPALFIRKADGTVFSRALVGNAYVMNEAGKTIASHGC
jgi:hypothetical protein